MKDLHQRTKLDLANANLRKIGVVFMAFVGIWAYGPSIVDAVVTWSENPDYSHGYLVVPLALFLLWSRRDRLDPQQFGFAWEGLSLILLAAVMRLVSGRFYLQEIDAWSIPIFIGGLVWTFYGWKTFVWAAPAVFFLWFATPMPQTLANWFSRPLQFIAAQASTIALQTFGQAAIREGTVIVAGDQLLDVARACSGLRMFYGILALAIAFVLLTRTRGWRAVVMIALAPPVAVVANVVRISITVLLYRFASTEIAEKFMHDFAGILMLPLAVLLFFLLNKLITRGLTDYQQDRNRTLRRLGMVAGTLALATVILSFWVSFQQRRTTKTLLTTVDRYAKDEEWSEAARYLQRYLAVEENDKDAWLQLVEIAKKSSKTYEDKRQTLALMQQVWTRFPEDIAIGREAIEGAIEIGDQRLAVSLSDQLLSNTNADEESTRTAIRAKAIALPNYLASSTTSNEYDWPQAVEALNTAIEQLGDNYQFQFALAQLYRQRRVFVRDGEHTINDQLADELIQQMVSAFPGEPMPLLARYYYGLSYWSGSDGAEGWQDDREEAVRLCKDAPEKWTVELYLEAANLAREQELVDEARAYLNRAIEQFPRNSQPYLLLGELEDLATDAGSVERKIDLFQRAIEKVDQPVNELFRILLAYEYAAAGRKAELNQEVSRLQRLIPSLSSPMLNFARLSLADIRAVAFEADGQIAAAAKSIEAGLGQDESVLFGTQFTPQVAAIRGRFADYLSQLGLHDLAANAYADVGRIAPEYPEWKMLAAAAYMSAGTPEEAIRLLGSELRERSTDPNILTTIAESEIRRQLVTPRRLRNWARAKMLVGQVQNAGLPNELVAVLGARIARAEGKLDAAKKALEQVAQTSRSIEAEPFWQMLARLSWESGDEEGGLAAAQRYGQITGDPSAAVRLRAGYLAEASRFEEAWQLLQESIQSTTEQATVTSLILQASLVLRGEGKNNEATELLKGILANDADSVEALTQLADIAWEDQNWDELQKYEQRLDELLPSQASVATFYFGIRQASQATSRQDPRLAEAAQISDLLIETRPNWPPTHVLAGEVAAKRGLPSEALAELQTAWQLGMIRPFVANGILELLTQLNRYDEAIAFADQVRDYISNSSQLFDQVIPFVKGEEFQQEAVRIATQWVRREPTNAVAWARLGRVLALSDSTEQSSNQLVQSRQAFQRATDISPDDVEIWLAAFSSYFDEAKQNEAGRIVQKFAGQTKIKPLERAFVLAQFYDALGMTDKASAQFRRVIDLADRLDQVEQIPLLIRAGGFFAAASPRLAETIYRRALAIESEDVTSRLVFAEFLLDRGGDLNAENLDEIDQLLAGITAGPGVNDIILDQVRRARARVAILREDQDRITICITEIESIPRASISDRLILVSLYQKANRTERAFDVLRSLVEDPTAQAPELEAFIRFWNDHFLEAGHFNRDKERAYDQLATQSETLVLPFRLRLEEEQLRRGADSPLVWEDVSNAIQKSTRVAPNFSSPETHVRDFMVELLQQDLIDHAIRLLENPPEGIGTDQASIAMCSALVSARITETSQMDQIKGLLRQRIREHAGNKELFNRYAELLMTRGEVDEALQIYRRMFDSNIDRSWETMNNLAIALMHTPDGKADALKLVNRALRELPANSTLLDTKAMILLALGNSTEALDIVQGLQQAGNASPVLLLHLAVIFDNLGKIESAKSSLVDALAMGCRMQILDKWDRSNLKRLTQTFDL